MATCLCKSLALLRKKMNINPRLGRYVLWTAAMLVFTIAPMIVAGVIPVVGTYTSPYANSESIFIILWAATVFSFVAALALALTAVGVRRLGGSSGFLLCVIMLIALLFSFAISNIAFDLHTHGRVLRLAAILLHLCSAADFAAALLIVLAVILFPKRRVNGLPRVQGATAN